MARPLRVTIEGGWYHVSAHEINGMRLFGDDRDREHLLALFEEAVGRETLQGSDAA